MRIGIIAGAICGVAIGGIVGGAVRGMRDSRVSLPRQQTQVSSVNDGSEPLINVELEPTAVVSDIKGEALEYSLSIAPRANAKATAIVKYAVEIRASDGTEMAKPEKSKALSIEKSGGHGRVLTMPRIATDGYYVVRVQAAAANDVEDTLAVIERYFRIVSGHVEPVSGDVYYQESGVNVASSP